MQTYLETQQSLFALLERACLEGGVRIQREDGRTFVLRSGTDERSPLDVKGIDLGISTDEIVEFIREGRTAA